MRSYRRLLLETVSVATGLLGFLVIAAMVLPIWALCQPFVYVDRKINYFFSP